MATERGPASGRRLTVLSLVDQIGIAGGGERFAHELAIHLDPDRFERLFCISRWDEAAKRHPEAGAVIDELQSAEVEFVGLDRSSARDLAAWRPLLRLLRERPVDVLHSHKFGSNVWGAALARLARTPVFVAHEQTWSYEGRPVRRFLDRELIARRAAAFIAVSSEDRRRMIEIERIDPQRVVFVPNAVPSLAPREIAADIRAELGIGAEVPVVGTVCVLRPQKALEVLLEATAKLTPRFGEMKLVIAGGGEERERLERIARDLGLEGTVEFLGMRTDVPDVLAALDVWVSCSDYEGTSLAVMESMEAGLPIVATRVGGTPDLIDDGVHGLLVEPRDPDALAAAIAALLDDRERAARLGRAAQERCRTEFEISTAAERFGALYEQLYADVTRAGSPA